MAEEIVRRIWCDVHMAQGEREEGKTRTIALDGRKARKVDLCDVHEKELLGPLVALLAEAPIVRDGGDSAASAGEPLNPRKRIDCPVCAAEGTSHVVFARSSIRNHFDEQHDVSLIEWETANGATVDGKPLPYPCDLCGLKFSHATGLGAHKRIEHGVTGASSTATKRRTRKAAAAPK